MRVPAGWEYKVKKLGCLTSAFLAIGIGMLAVALALWAHTHTFIANAERAPGTVIEMREVRDDDGSSTYKPVVEFSAQGNRRTFESSFSSRPPAYSVGEMVEVLYHAKDPADARINGFGSLWLGPIIVGSLGALFAAIAGGIVLAGRMSERRKQWLSAYGTAIQTEFQGVERNTSLTVNGRHPWRITSQWQDPSDSKLHIFSSENLWFDPTRFVTGKQITVLLDPKDSSRYHMDVSFLPDVAGK